MWKMIMFKEVNFETGYESGERVSVMNIWDGVPEVRRRAANGSKPCGSQTGGRDCEMEEETRACDVQKYTENADRCVHITCIMHTFPHYHAGDPVRCTPFLAQYRITSMQSHTRTLIQSESLLFHRVYLLHSQKHWLSYSLIHMVMFSFKMTLPRLTDQQILPLSCCLV